jgi:CBS domain-containing protein
MVIGEEPRRFAMTVASICNRDVYTADVREGIEIVARRMDDRNVGTLVVIDASRHPIGIVTDRDLALRVLGEARDPAKTLVGDVMSSHPRMIEDSMPVEDALRTMRRLGVRRLPVVDASKKLVGMVSVDDVITLLARELGDLGEIVDEAAPGIRTAMKV